MRAHLVFLVRYVYWTARAFSGDLHVFRSTFGAHPEMTTSRIVLFSMSDVHLTR